MKYLKIAVLISLINAVFFGAFLYFIKNQNSAISPSANQMLLKNTDGSSVQTSTPGNTHNTSTKTLNTSNPNLPAPASGGSGTSANNTGVAPAPAPTPDPLAGHCIVTIKGQKYDVTDFKNTHSGGDIFVCGTDMTNTFFGQHNQRLLDGSVMQNLKVQ